MESFDYIRMSQKKEAFFDQNNEATLQRALYNDICRRIGGDLNEKQASRLMKTVKHYMGEVYRVKGSSQSITQMNKDVLVTVLPDYMMYMERTVQSSERSVISDIELGNGMEGAGEVRGYLEDLPTTAAASRPREQLDVGTAFTQLQSNRQNQNKVKAPEMPDFRMKLNDEGPVPVDVFERIKQDRETESARAAALSAAPTSGGMASFVAAGDSFVRERRRAQDAADEAYADQERRALEARVSAAQQAQGTLPLPPDMRSLYLGDRQNLDRTLNRMPVGMDMRSNMAAGNPTVALGTSERVPGGGRQQMIITREPESMEYKENELNLFVYSGDRDWISNSSETRYDFSVNFDPGNGIKGLGVSPTSTAKFRNIVRVELVKAIMPGESVDSLVTRTCNESVFTYSNAYNFNVLSFPYVQVYIPELDNNVYGTNQGLNAAFGVLQYDANWIYDTNNSVARGYIAMIPKFLKCQKTYTPTPLATLQKLSFRFERPDGDLVSTVPDTLDIESINSSKAIVATNAMPYGYDSAVENGTGAAYYFIRTSTFFNVYTVQKGDRIIVKNLKWLVAPGASTSVQLQDFLTYIEDDGGLLVVDIGYTNAGGAFSTITTDAANKQGYCNYIIVRGKFTDPTTGSLYTSSLGGLVDSSTPGSLTGDTLSRYLYSNNLFTGRLLNQSHQVQVALRIITREMDPTSVLRPDNL
jgi:hypothetical protein